MKVLLKNSQDESICLIFTDGYWYLPELNATNEAQAALELKKITGLAEVKITFKKNNLLHALCTDDKQENLDILIGWFNQEDAIRSIHEKEKILLQNSLQNL